MHNLETSGMVLTESLSEKPTFSPQLKVRELASSNLYANLRRTGLSEGGHYNRMALSILTGTGQTPVPFAFCYRSKILHCLLLELSYNPL